jgi:4-amino-4-deoxy-L-arabinose transferase-like glycosyltransferase
MAGPAVSSAKARDLTIGVFVGFTLGWALFIHSRSYSSNDASRLAAIESLVHRGAWAIDGSSFATVDKIKVGGHFYSDKPPLMAWLGAGVYAVLHHGFGLTLQAGGCAPEQTLALDGHLSL